ncbi:hypothetical protein K440DRAFT_627770 [Wilcoxina mikolae CBS 423.85]|nr:hypothetical protein K440DRAFT_627770 [Wilcoxina mikolae CBS 423.85]
MLSPMGTLSLSLSSLMATAGVSFKNIATLEACFLANMKIGMLLWRATKVQDHNAIEFVHVAMKGLLMVPLLDARGPKPKCVCGAS